MTSELKKIYADLWGLYNLSSQSNNIYTTILMYKYTEKTWTLYLQEKNNLVDMFQILLSQAEAKGRHLIKTLTVNGEEEFLLHKL